MCVVEVAGVLAELTEEEEVVKTKEAPSTAEFAGNAAARWGRMRGVQVLCMARGEVVLAKVVRWLTGAAEGAEGGRACEGWVAVEEALGYGGEASGCSSEEGARAAASGGRGRSGEDVAEGA